MKRSKLGWKTTESGFFPRYFLKLTPSFPQNLLDQAKDLITKLLTSEWLVTDVEQAGGKPHFDRIQHRIQHHIELSLGDQRRRELIRIRQIYVPELIIRLHVMLVSPRHRIPQFASKVRLHCSFLTQFQESEVFA